MSFGAQTQIESKRLRELVFPPRGGELPRYPGSRARKVQQRFDAGRGDPQWFYVSDAVLYAQTVSQRRIDPLRRLTFLPPQGISSGQQILGTPFRERQHKGSGTQNTSLDGSMRLQQARSKIIALTAQDIRNAFLQHKITRTEARMLEYELKKSKLENI